MNPVSLSVFVAFFLLVTVLGFVASRWQKADLTQFHEWGLGGKRFGVWITWFLLGGDLYTAYTVIAVPALVYSVGAYGFFAVPYTILIYPFAFLVMARLWTVCHEGGHMTAADLILGHYKSRPLECAVALTGIVATMPYIALQLVGMQSVFAALGLGTGHIPLFIAFVVLALYTYSSGLRAPAMIAFVKDIMIYVVVFAAVAIIPAKLGGYGAIFDAADAHFKAGAASAKTGLLLHPAQFLPYATVALGSALALFMYPHTMTGVLSATSARTIRKNMMLLPAYSVVLGLIALMGYMAISAGITVTPETKNDIVPLLFKQMFPAWFVGFAFAAIAIGALVPAAIMSIGTANLFTRNIWKPFIHPGMDSQEEGRIAKLASTVVKAGALLVILLMPTQYAIDFQLLGGVCMLQILPAVLFALYSKGKFRMNGAALFVGWLVGIVVGISLAYSVGLKPIYSFHIGGGTYGAYIGIVALAANFIVSFAGSALAGKRAS
ncbi:solute:Na+ symporter, SSS family [Verrucomicrobium sp. GAS474]|uniref:monocarboxylate uptake permease MctP n=1 Tax=Verrucomicrobium sp. GAS474 TaxID=1882831 RepID=UPI000879C8CE|nr:sodium:solute symporter [Verrucomicrobium sp. GAS474]SDT88216.1 solute:Na+ symporter, SSS family [Verrucomicrobium sp. GAS474]